MDYVVGSVAALISGNVTPNRPRKFKKALTPTKHQPSPNVTPKSEFVEDRSIFLSPTMQKKKAIVKKSPKRIFQNPDLDVTNEDEGNSSVSSPKAIKVKKHLKEELDGTAVKTDESLLSPKSPKNVDDLPKTKKKLKTSEVNKPEVNKNMSKKKYEKQSISVGEDESLPVDENNLYEKDNEKENLTTNVATETKTPKKKRKRSKSFVDTEVDQEANVESLESNESTKCNNVEEPKTKKKKNKLQQNSSTKSQDTLVSVETNVESSKKKNKKKKISQANVEKRDNIEINPNAVTNEDTDSEHESDDEMDSENEEINKKALDPGPAEESSDEEEQKPKNESEKKEDAVITEEEVKRTIFVGNVPFSNKCKKEIKKIFSQYGQIETIRIRTVPVKDARVTPKMAVIKNELHPDRSTVNVYVKFADEASVEKALSANNTVLQDHHLRVSRSDSTGAEHDPKCSVFVGNIPFAIEDETLRSKFEKCGEIESVRIIRDKKTNAGKGFGYINFASKDGVELALALTEEDLTIKNRIMRVKRCTQTTQKKANKPNNRQANQNQGQNRQGYQNQGQSRQGYQNKGQSSRQGYQNQGQNRQCYQNQGQNRQGYQNQGQNRQDYQNVAQNRQGFQNQGQNRQGYQNQGQNRQGYQNQGQNRQGFQNQGQNRQGFQNQRQNQNFQKTSFGRQDVNNFNKGRFNDSDDKNEGAYRRIMKKRKIQDGGEEPADKLQNLNQPHKEKKVRKEFVGMTAEKKKKHKFDKGQKKKKILSEILTKK